MCIHFYTYFFGIGIRQSKKRKNESGRFQGKDKLCSWLDEWLKLVSPLINEDTLSKNDSNRSTCGCRNQIGEEKEKRNNIEYKQQ